MVDSSLFFNISSQTQPKNNRNKVKQHWMPFSRLQQPRGLSIRYLLFEIKFINILLRLQISQLTDPPNDETTIQTTHSRKQSIIIRPASIHDISCMNSVSLKFSNDTRISIHSNTIIILTHSHPLFIVWIFDNINKLTIPILLPELFGFVTVSTQFYPR